LSWEKVYIFISSTFNDMHAERDFLVKRVFPRLRDWCERRRLRMMDIDLRWGVTEHDATRHAAVVDVCLSRIDACRPFFVCLLGQRYGWIPGLQDVSPRTIDAFPGLGAALAQGLSVTELEVLHAVLRPFGGGHPAPEPGTAGQALFYLRDPSSLEGLPGEPGYLRRTFDDGAEEDGERRLFLLDKQKKLRETTVPSTDRPVVTYECSWDPESFSPELALPLKCPALLPQNVERWRRLWREAAGVEVGGLDVEEDPAQGAKARAFNERITAGRLSGFRAGGEDLGERLLRDLEEAIERRYPDHVERPAGDALDRENDDQEQFLFVNSEGFVDRAGDFDALDAYLAGGPERPFALTGSAGSGKTMLLANWIDRSRTRGTGAAAFIGFRFVGASDGATSVPTILRSLLLEMKRNGAIAGEIPADPQELRRAWPALIAEAGETGGTVLVVDGLDQLESGLRDLTWVPLTLPPGVRLVVSFKPEAPLGVEALRLLREAGAVLGEVPPFDRAEDRRRLVRAYLSQYLKELDEEHIEALIAVEGASRPLFLKVVLSELRVFGAFASLGEKIVRDFGRTPVEAFESVLRRLESDPAYAPLEPAYAVPRLFGLLSHARRGLSIDELGSLLNREPRPGAPPEGSESAAADSASTYLRQVRPFLARREGRYDFFYDAFRQAARERYTASEGPGPASRRPSGDWHRTLADYFERLPLWLPPDGEKTGAGPSPAARAHRRKVSELPYHFACCGDVKGLERTLASLEFIEAKCQAGLIYDLEADYARLQADGAVLRPTVITPLVWQGRTGAECPYCRGSFELSGPSSGGLSSCPLCSSRLRLTDFTIERPWQPRPAKRSVDRSEKLELAVPPAIGQFADFVRARSYLLAEWPVLAWQEAANAAAETAPKKAAVAARLSGRMKRPWLRRVNRPWVAAPLMTLTGHEGSVVDVAASNDGRRILSLGIDGSLRVWDAESGAPVMVKRAAVVPGKSGRFCLVPPGDLVLVVSESTSFEQGPIRLWNFETGQLVHEFTWRDVEPKSLAVSPDGRRFSLAFQRGDDRGKEFRVIVLLWDLERPGEAPAEVPMRKGLMFPGIQAFTPDGRKLLISTQTQLDVLDLETKTFERTMAWSESGMFKGAMCAAVSPDGGFALTAGWDAIGRVWDLRTGALAATMVGHKGPIERAVFTPDGAEAVDVCLDTTVKVWDVKTGDSLTTLRGQDPLFSVAVTPDGSRAVTGDQKGRVQVWDLSVDREYFREGRRVMRERMQSLPEPDRSDRRNLEALLEFMHGGQRHFGPTNAALSRDGKHLVTAGEVDRLLRTWDIQTGKIEHVLGNGRDDLSLVAISPDGTRVLTGDNELKLRLWDVTAEKVLAERSGPEAAQRHEEKGGPNLMTMWKDMTTGPRLLALQFTPDGRQVLSADSLRPGIWLWDGHSLADAGSIPAAQGAGPNLLFAGSGGVLVVPTVAGAIHVVDFPARSVVRTLKGFSSGVLRLGKQGALDISPDGRLVACGWQDHTVRVWALSTGAEAVILEDMSRRHPVVSVAISPDGEFVAASFATWSSTPVGDMEIGAWSLASGRRVFERRFSTTRVNFAWTQVPKHLMTGGPDEMLRLWDLDQREPVTVFAARPAILLAQGLTTVAVEEGGEVFILELTGARPRSG
jgi:WD40 repeat protein